METKSTMISFVIPAHNEERLLAATIRAIHRASLSPGDVPYEIVVVDDASIDRTAEIATEENARVIPVNYRHIAATRDAGARASRGDILIFVDADTIIEARVIRAAIAAVEGGAVGGAAIGVFDGALPLYARALAAAWTGIARLSTFTTGCFLFCTRSAYETVGGFDRTLFAFEDVAFGRALQRLGRVVILSETVSTSSRNLRAHNLADAFRMLLALVIGGRRFFKSRDALGYWYARKPPNDTAARPRPNEEW